ncbi:MAG: flagellar basal body rod C-terminal domain-containing protein [Arcobacteraceae bacterium]
MQVNNNINSMMQLEKRLEKSASELSKLNLNNENASENKKQLPSDTNVENKEDVNLVQEMVEQIVIPIAYNANAEVISTQSSMHKTLLDIKA